MSHTNINCVSPTVSCLGSGHPIRSLSDKVHHSVTNRGVPIIPQLVQFVC